MSRHYDADGLCRYCRRIDGEHRASCVLAPEPPVVDPPHVADNYDYDRLDDRLVATITGEPNP